MNTSERFFLFSIFLSLSQPTFAWKEAMMVFSNFLSVFAIFHEFSITGPLGTHRNNFFFFLTFSGFRNLFWLEKKLWFYFLNFEFFCYFFWIFYYESGRKTSEWFFFYFLSISSFPNLSCLKKKLWWYFIIFWIFLLFFWNFLLWVG